jgi:xanthine/uracil permease
MYTVYCKQANLPVYISNIMLASWAFRMSKQKNSFDFLGAILHVAIWVLFAPFQLLALIIDGLPSWFWPQPPNEESRVTFLGLLKEFKCTLVTMALIFVLSRYGREMPPLIVLLLGLWAVFYFVLVIFEWANSRFTLLRWIAVAVFIIFGLLWVLRSQWPLHW